MSALVSASGNPLLSGTETNSSGENSQDDEYQHKPRLVKIIPNTPKIVNTRNGSLLSRRP